jgi:hypothetical protein
MQATNRCAGSPCCSCTYSEAVDRLIRRPFSHYFVATHFAPLQLPMLLRGLLMRLVDLDHDVLLACSKAMLALNARVGPEALVPHLTFACGVISSVSLHLLDHLPALVPVSVDATATSWATLQSA